MKISVIIPAFNEEKYIGDCLRACVEHAPENLLEIIVVNNAGTDRTPEIAKQFPLVRVVNEPRKGLTRARQRGLQESKGELIFSIDADTRPPTGWFQAMEERLKQPNVVCVSGPYVLFDIPAWQRFFVAAYWKFSGWFTSWSTGYMIVGGNFATRKAALEQIGGFDTSIEFYGEDTDIARRLSKIGKVVYSTTCWINSSGRRLTHEGWIKTALVYMINYVWIAIFHRPFTKTYTDVR